MPFALLSASPAIDTGMVSEVVNLCKTVIGLFSEFPLNVYLIAGLACVGLGIFGVAKSAVR